MCGITGEIRFDGPPDPEAVRRMTQSLFHRGPDEEGYFFAGPVAFGHRRLSILDLVGGTQPMTREGCTLIFNGQAYEHESLRQSLRERGHSFTTRSDTEVVLRAYLEWGESFVERVHGMFAMALWDSREQKLVLARDRMGKKPLYYALGAGGAWASAVASADSAPLFATRIVFGSEPKALLARGDLPIDLDENALVQYLALEYVPSPLSIYRSVRKLPAAHLAILDQKGFRMRRYWDFPRPTPKGVPDQPEAELLRLLDESVARRLVADVPVGVFLSGGVDSTSIAALAARHRSRLDTFSIGFDEPSFDESAYSSLAAKRLGTEHHFQRLSGSACLDEIPAAVAHLDEPFADPSILPTLLLSRFARRRVTVALAGDGGDELFAGYDTFLAHRPARLLAAMPPPIRSLFVAAAQRLPAADTNMSFDFRLKQLLRGLSAPASLRHQVWIGSFLPAELRELLHPDLLPRMRDEIVYQQVLEDAARAKAAGISTDSVDAALRFYLDRYLVDDILVKADRASMAASLELRAPFLDTHVVEFAARLPSAQKLGLWHTKLVLKRAVRALVPREILRRPKKGFGIPVARWIRGPLRSMFEDLFSPQSLAASSVFQVTPAQRLLQRHLRGEADLRKPLWTMAIFLLWQRRWARSNLSVPQASAA